ncbi:hypothetical protein CDEST_09297 [Colletotrichum destructivum]|uniref:Uncharacterized protein n=1 Tax=Colletotrichum destructivum TaxID=34406 RepID=A0AAX4IMN8_9PEZI|nr:hypothetical protein CDEST_09297 [Colletotrichum destructivum]
MWRWRMSVNMHCLYFNLICRSPSPSSPSLSPRASRMSAFQCLQNHLVCRFFSLGGSGGLFFPSSFFRLDDPGQALPPGKLQVSCVAIYVLFIWHGKPVPRSDMWRAC